MPTIRDIQIAASKLVAEGRDEAAIAYLMEAIGADRPAYYELIQLQARLENLEEQERKGIISHENATTTRNQIRDGITENIKNLRLEDLKGHQSADHHLLHDWHKLTCDRTRQNSDFQKIKLEKEQDRTHFFYLYGLDRHAHQALVERFTYDLQGILRNYLNPEIQSSCTVEKELYFSLMFYEDPEEYKTEILANLFTAFGVPPDPHSPLLESTLHDLWQNSPRLQQLGAEDYVCCYLSIPEIDWDPEITPQVVRWLVETFCGDHLPAEAPTFFFFFGVEFEEDSAELRAEVEAAVRAGGHLNMLPELHMVVQRDIKRWLNTYRKYMPERSRRDEFFDRFFAGDPEVYMEDVLLHLQTIIDEINNPQ